MNHVGGYKYMDISSAHLKHVSPGDPCEGGLEEAQGLQRP